MKLTAIIAITAITILEGIALFKGIDGTIFLVAIATIAGLGGYVAGKLR